MNVTTQTELYKQDTSEQANLEGEKSCKATTLHKEHRELRIAGKRRDGPFAGNSTPTGYSALKIHILVTLY